MRHFSGYHSEAVGRRIYEILRGVYAERSERAQNDKSSTFTVQYYHSIIYMSIIDLAQIGGWLKRNQADIAIFAGFILVSLIAFGAGRLTAPEIVRNPVIIEEPNASGSSNIFGSVSQSVPAPAGDSVDPPRALTGQGSVEGLFVASRGGTKYHWPWCSYGEKIKLTNQIWFNSEKEARSAGYSPCGCITSKAPAGYQNP